MVCINKKQYLEETIEKYLLVLNGKTKAQLENMGVDPSILDKNKEELKSNI